MQPACRHLHAIAELHVPSVHIIHHFDQFLYGLVHNLPEANRQYEELMASKADLARHFRLGATVDIRMERRRTNKYFLHLRQIQMCVLRHTLELFRGCQLRLELRDPMASHGCMEDPDELLGYLSLLAPTRPFCIAIVHDTELPRLQVDMLLREPIILACRRLILNFYSQNKKLSAETICHWLHHLPAEDGETEEEEENEKNSEQNPAKTFNINSRILPSTSAQIIERCKQSLQKAESVSDRRLFLLNFELDSRIPLFKLENGASGEVLQLEENQLANLIPNEVFYQLRRCPAANLNNDTFRYNQSLQFRMHKPKLRLH